ncbi:MAG: hypothetical protein IH987_08325 [Planctomycetes bacterium]|nr:hypothetical protein [Planctomycetota bacterium]
MVRADAEQAIALDETLGEAHIALAVYKASYEWDWQGAEREFKRGIQLNPSHATGYQWYAEFLASQGRVDEALKEIRRARDLDPASRIIQTVVGLIYYRAHRFDDVIEQCAETLDFDPDFPYAHYTLGLAYAEKAMFEEAISEINEAIALGGRSTEYVTALAYVYAAAKMSDQAARILDELKRRAKTQYVAAYDFAFIHAGLGDEDAAFRWLDLAVEERGQDLSWLLKVDPKLESLHSDPRFADLLRRVGFEPTAAPST